MYGHGGARPGAGRKKGSKNPPRPHYETIAVFARSIVEDPVYQAQLLVRAQKGQLQPHIEVMLYGYAYGKPTEQRAPDDQAFLESLLAVVLQHVGSREAREAIRAVIEAHAGGTGLRVVA